SGLYSCAEVPVAVRVREVGTITVLRPQGTLSIDHETPELRQAALGAMDAGARDLVVNFQDVSSAASSGIAQLVSMHTIATTRGVRVKGCCASPALLELFQTVQLDTVYEMYDTEAAALDSF